MSNQGVLLKDKTKEQVISNTNIKEELLVIGKRAGISILSSCLRVTAMILTEASKDIGNIKIND